MQNDAILLTPLPQFKLGEAGMKLFNLPESKYGKLDSELSIEPLMPVLRRQLLNLTKEMEGNDDLLQLICESDLIFTAKMPYRGREQKITDIHALFYSVIASEILRRIHRCWLLFDWVPEPIFNPPWFFGFGPSDCGGMRNLKSLQREWVYIDQWTNIDWRSGDDQRIDIGLALLMIQEYWPNLCILHQIGQLNSIYTNPNKERGIIAAAKEYSTRKREEIFKDKHGLCADSSKDSLQDAKAATGDAIPLPISPKWLIKGLQHAIDTEVSKLSQDLHNMPSGKRLVRAMQFFQESFRITEPYRFVSFVTSLESIFCTSKKDVTFQVASRLSGLLANDPADEKNRLDITTEANKLYDLRSNIVHGKKYSVEKIDDCEHKLIELARQAFRKVLKEERLFGIFQSKDEKACDEYLESLSRGAPSMRREEDCESMG